MDVTVSDVWLAYEEAIKDPYEAMVIEAQEKARRAYRGHVYCLDDCGEGDTYDENVRICNRCSNRHECLKRWQPDPVAAKKWDDKNRWEAAFNEWTEFSRRCEHGSICKWCDSNCLQALRRMCRETGVQIDYEKCDSDAFEAVWSMEV